MDGNRIDPSRLQAVLATDCGSTTTKAILFEKKEDGWRSTFRGEAPTTVEKPLADVCIGAVNAFSEVQELSGRKLLNEGPEMPLIIRNSPGERDGVDLFVSTSSAGGGLQMCVLGVVGNMSAESAERAALGAGAIVMDTVSIDDDREQHEHVEKIRHLRPDIALIAGGTDGGTIDHPLQLAETLLQADPRPRFGDTLRLPVIYAANSAAADQARAVLDRRFAFTAVDNIRPVLERENLAPARDAIHELFLNHVMSHAPGYKKLLSWSPVPILPTPAAVGNMVLSAARTFNLQILAVDIGGATTDVFSAFRGAEDDFIFNRTVSANLGMSYSVANVLLEAGERNIQRWLPFTFSSNEIRNRLRNKMIRPTTIPQTLEDLIVEQAVCREALRLALIHHRRLAVGLKGLKTKRTIGDMFKQGGETSIVNMKTLDLIIGSGGVLSHAPDRRSAALMMLDAYEPEGVTRLAVDSVFMMPHLGVLSSVHPEAAAEIFVRDCIVDLGTAVAANWTGKAGQKLMRVQVGPIDEVLRAGELRVIKLEDTKPQEALITPLASSVDCGAGRGKPFSARITGGPAGLILDGRGRPLRHAGREEDRVKEVRLWHEQFGLNWS